MVGSESSHGNLKSGHGWQEAIPTAGMGLARSTTGVGPDPLPACRVFLGHGSPVGVWVFWFGYFSF